MVTKGAVASRTSLGLSWEVNSPAHMFKATKFRLSFFSPCTQRAKGEGGVSRAADGADGQSRARLGTRRPSGIRALGFPRQGLATRCKLGTSRAPTWMAEGKPRVSLAKQAPLIIIQKKIKKKFDTILPFLEKIVSNLIC